MRGLDLLGADAEIRAATGWCTADRLTRRLARSRSGGSGRGGREGGASAPRCSSGSRARGRRRGTGGSARSRAG